MVKVILWIYIYFFQKIDGYFTIYFIQELLNTRDQHVQLHSEYQDSFQSFNDLFQLSKERYALCNDSKGDRYAVTNKLERSQVDTKY